MAMISGVCGGDDSTCRDAPIPMLQYCPDCIIYDGSCTFELYPGDVNRDGYVDEKDVDGLEFFGIGKELKRCDQ